MPRKGYKQPEQVRKAKAETTRQWWERIKLEVEETNAVLQAAGEEHITVHQYLRGEKPKAPRSRQPYRMTKEHKEKLRKIAIERNYAERLKPYRKPPVHRTPVEERAHQAKQKLRKQQLASRKRAAMRFTRECMVGVHGHELEKAILAQVGSLDVQERHVVVEAMEFLIEIGFLEPFSTVSATTRKKLSEAAYAAHYRRKNKVAQLQEDVRQKWVGAGEDEEK